jgi:hypothetical protein
MYNPSFKEVSLYLLAYKRRDIIFLVKFTMNPWKNTKSYRVYLSDRQ